MSELARRLRGRRNLFQRTRSEIEQEAGWPDQLDGLNWHTAEFRGTRFEYALGYGAGSIICLNDPDDYFISSTNQIKTVFDSLSIDYSYDYTPLS